MSASGVRPLACVMAVGLFAGTAFAVNIETVAVGNPGNAGDSLVMWDGTSGYGAVAYEYSIGKYPVTAGQYTVFLNAVAKTDTYGLYHQYMNLDAYPSYWGCNIKRSGSSGSYTYSVASDYANRPVNFVSWGDSARFANWLHNGQPTGAQGASTTEDGAYGLATTQQYYNPDGSVNDLSGLNAALLAVNRNANWKWAITSEDEWYKAAYHKNDGVTGNYWDYPTSSDTINTSMANYDWSVGHTTDVGAYPYPSPYGTFDQGGNVWEWNEAVLYGSSRGLRGGAFALCYDIYLLASNRGYFGGPSYEGFLIGFRVSEVPKPTSLAILAFGAIGVLVRHRGLGR